MAELSYERGLLRVYKVAADGSQEIVGAAFLVSEDRALTCAHVVLDALGQHAAFEADDTYRPADGDIVSVDFVHLPGNPMVKTTVEGWYAFQANPIFSEAEDIAVLRLVEPLPAGAEPFVLTVSTDSDIPVTVQGFPRGFDGGDIVEGKLFGSTAQGWMQLDTTLVQKAIVPGFSGAPVWNEQRNVIGMVTRSASRRRKQDGNPSAYMIPTVMLQRALPLLFNPYKGLEAFQEADSRRYYGRTQETDELVTQLNQEPYVAAIIGNSGSGKSSLVFAGVLPHLRKQQWQPIIFRPRSDPFAELARALRSDEVVGNLPSPKPLNADTLREDMSLLCELARALAERTEQKIMLIADQFEEVYTLTSQQQYARNNPSDNTHNPQRGRDFVEKLLHTLQSQPKYEAPVLGLMLTMRSDFVQHALASVTFTAALKKYQYPLGAISRENLTAAIERPAQAQNVRLEDGLTALILRDVNTAVPAAHNDDLRLQDSFDGSDLPLVQFALTELWRQQKYRHGHYTLTLADYNAIGGVRGALGKYAETRYQRLSFEDRERVKAIFISLIRLEEMESPTREILDRMHFSEDQWELVKRLDKERLLVLGHEDERQQDTVEVMHEALINGWDTLHAWVSNSREFLLWRTRLRRAMQEWEKRGKSSDELLRGSRLKEAEVQLAQHRERLSQPEKDYIQKGTKSRQRRRRITTSLGVAVTLVLTLLTAFSVFQWQETQNANEALASTNENLQTTNTQLENANSALEESQLALEQERDNAQQQAEIAQQQADIALNLQLRAQARLAASAPSIINGFPDQAPLLAMQAVKTNPSTENYAQLRDVMSLLSQ